MIKLSTARAIGQENISAARALIKDMKAGKPVVEANFSATQGQIRDLAEILSPGAKAQAAQGMAMVNMLNPRLASDAVRTDMNVVVKNLGQGKIYSVKGVASDAEGVLQTAQYKVLDNPSATRVVAKGEGADMKMSADAVFLKRSTLQDPEATFIKGFNYEEADGVGKMTIKANDAGIVKKLDVEMTAPAQYLDAVTNATSNGRFNSMSEMVESVKSM